MKKELLEKIYDRLVNGYIENKDYQWITGYDDIDKFFNQKNSGCITVIVGIAHVRDILTDNIIYNYLEKNKPVFCYVNNYTDKEYLLQKLLLMYSGLNPYKIRDYLKDNVDIKNNLKNGVDVFCKKDMSIITGYNSIENFEDFKKYIITNDVQNLFIEDVLNFRVDKIDYSFYVKILSELLKDCYLSQETKEIIKDKLIYLENFPELCVDKTYAENFYMEIPFTTHSTIENLTWENLSKGYVLQELKNIAEKYKMNIFIETNQCDTFYIKDVDKAFVEFSDLLLVVRPTEEEKNTCFNNVIAYKDLGKLHEWISLGIFDEQFARITGIHREF